MFFLKPQNESTYFYGNEIHWVEGLGTVKNRAFSSQEGYQFYDEQPWTIMLSLGYELSYQLSKRFSLNAQINYYQSLRPMMRWNQMHEYSESATGYSEKSVQWFSSKLSHLALSLGVSYTFGSVPSEK